MRQFYIVCCVKEAALRFGGRGRGGGGGCGIALRLPEWRLHSHTLTPICAKFGFGVCAIHSFPHPQVWTAVSVTILGSVLHALYRQVRE